MPCNSIDEAIRKGANKEEIQKFSKIGGNNEFEIMRVDFYKYRY